MLRKSTCSDGERKKEEKKNRKRKRKKKKVWKKENIGFLELGFNFRNFNN